MEAPGCYICKRAAPWRGRIAGFERPICGAVACQRRAAVLPREHCFEREQGQLCGQRAVARFLPGLLGLCRRHLQEEPTGGQSARLPR